MGAGRRKINSMTGNNEMGFLINYVDEVCKFVNYKLIKFAILNCIYIMLREKREGTRNISRSFPRIC
jgi:hypothetical protein